MHSFLINISISLYFCSNSSVYFNDNCFALLDNLHCSKTLFFILYLIVFAFDYLDFYSHFCYVMFTPYLTKRTERSLICIPCVSILIYHQLVALFLKFQFQFQFHVCQYQYELCYFIQNLQDYYLHQFQILIQSEVCRHRNRK